MKHHYYFCRKFGFTLAEVLITLGIIGVVAALTIPSLMAKHQKQVLYTQFRKAASQLENALQMYELDHGCIGNINACADNEASFSGHTYLNIDNFIDDFAKYFNVTQLINKDNYRQICANYDKITDLDHWTEAQGSELCIDDGMDVENTTAFITNNGALYTFARDAGAGGGNFVDVNGPNKGPNLVGRDIFVFYIDKKIYWGGDDNYDHECEQPDNYYGCAAKLLQEGKMNY